MSIVKVKHYPVSKSFNSLIDDFFQGFPSIYRDDFSSRWTQNIPVNVRETEKGYQLEVIAPGFGKEDFKVSIDKNLLTIEAEKKSSEESKTEKYIRKEYQHQSFKRSFILNGKIDTEKIEAKYENGVLYINLFQKQEVKAAVKEIAIS